MIAASSGNKRKRLERIDGNLSIDGGGAAAAKSNREEDSILSYDNEDGVAVPDNIPHCYRDPNPSSQAKVNALRKLKGSRLEPIVKLLAPHPVTSITTTIASANAMLTLLFNIKQREISFLRFDSQIVVRDKDGKAFRDEATGKDKT